MQIDKVVEDGLVAVLVSPGYGAGWSTWNRGEASMRMTFDPDIVEWVRNGKVGQRVNLEEKYGEDYICQLGWDQLEIVWLPVGTQFSIDEYDGFESIELLSSSHFMEA
ncbi:MAG: hypothetical protein ACO23H_12010 [Alphaproteobacteria bacterium]